MKRLFVLVFAALFLAGCRTPALRTALSGPDRIDPHGGLYFDATPADLETAGIRAGDLVRIRLGTNAGTEAAVVPTFRCVSVGSPALVSNPESGRPLQLTIAYGCAALDYGLAERDPETRAWVPAKDIGFPLETEIVRTRAGGARAHLALASLRRTNARQDYPTLTDAEFANARAMDVPGIASGAILRSSSPADPSLGRNAAADAAARAAHARAVFDMADTDAAFRAFPDVSSTYVASLPAFRRPLGVDPAADEFARDLADGFRFLLAYDTPWLLHCKEGQDRTGFACALLEILAGAPMESVENDYLESFRLYYGVGPGHEAREPLRTNLHTILARAFRGEAPSPAAARAYLLRGGLTAAEVDALAAKLRQPPLRKPTP